MAKHLPFFALLALSALATHAGGYVQHVPGDVSDSRQQFQLRVARGEVVDLSIDFLDGGEPLDITGAAVTLHTRTNGMDAAVSWQTSGTATNNSALFVLDVDAVLPQAAGQWSCVALRGGRTLARIGGPAYVRGTAAGSAAALPQSVLAAYATTNYVAEAVAAIPPFVETDPIFETWAETNKYVKAENDPLGRFALRRTLAETNSASWTVIAGDGVELLDDGSVVAFTNEYVAAGDGYVVRSFDIVPVSPRGGVPLDAAIFEDWSAGSPDAGAIFPEGPEVGIVPTNGILRVEVAFRRGERRYKVSRCILAVRSLSFGPADMAEAARDDLTADDYRFRDNIGEASLGNLRQWATDEFAAKSAEKWWQTTAGGGVSLGGNTLALGAGRFAQTLDADATNVLLTAGGQDALRVVDGYGLDADTNAEWRISGLRRTGTNVEVTVRCAMPGPWKSVALHGSRDAAEWEETDFAPAIDGETWTYLVPTNTGYRFFKCAGSLVAHPDSRIESDFSISALGDVTASNGVHRLSAKADAADLAGYSPTGHVHAAADIASGTLSADRIPNLAASKITSGTIADARIPASIVRNTRLAGQTFDFADLRGLYVAVSNLAAALGGTVTNFPSFQQ